MPALISFRDPAGSCFALESRFYRSVNADAVPTLERFLHSPMAGRLVKQGSLISTRKLAEQELGRLNGQTRQVAERSGTVFEHERVALPSYAHEWPAEMLYAAGSLTLDIAEGLLEGGFGLKDATPHNILFRGAKPVFVDLLSFEPRNAGDPMWRPHAQFIRTFLLPLLACKHFGMREGGGD